MGRKIPGWKVKLTIEGEGATQEMLAGIADRASDAKPVLKVIQGLMRQQAEATFASEGASLGHPWVKDKPDTIAKKLAAGYPNRTEVMTGDLFDSLTRSAGGGNSIRRLSRYSTTFGTRLFYAQWAGHKRRLLAITAESADIYAERMVRWLVEGHL